MKLDKIKFARLIGYITYKCGSIAADTIECIDDIIDIEMVAPKQVSCSPDRLNDLLLLMANGQKKIEAIKVYRELTGAGLKESKDAVEAYWVIQQHPVNFDKFEG